MSISFFIPGTPATAGSKKGFYNKKLKRVMMVAASKKTVPWMANVRFFARNAYQGDLLEGPVKLCIEFRLMRPKSHYGTGRNSGVVKATHKGPYHFKLPDLTKLTRALEDALKGITWRDDSQVCIQETRKVYVDRGPGAMVKISQINECAENSLDKHSE